MFDIVIDLKNYSLGSTYERTSVRAIVKKDNQYLFVQEHHHRGYEFPGGGVEIGETDQEALSRELIEETGYRIRQDSMEYVGSVKIIRKGKQEDKFVMIARYYYCELENKIPDKPLEDYNVDFIDLKQAFMQNLEIGRDDDFSWLKREIVVMNYLLLNQQNKE